MTQAKDRQRKGFEDSVGIEEFRGKYRFNFSRKLSRQYWGKTQQRISTGLTVCKENRGKVEETAWKIHYDVLSDNFNADDLTKYGLGEKPNLTVITPIKKQLTILEIYDMYCESRKGTIAETTMKKKMHGEYRRIITKAIKNAGEDSLAIRNWIIQNIGNSNSKNCLRYLDKAYQLGIKHKYCVENPFEDMHQEIKPSKNKKQNQEDFDKEGDDTDSRAFTVDEMNTIIEAFNASHYRRHLAPIIKFLFWTGCRTGEAIALKWRDIKWDKEIITIRRTYDYELNIFKSTKTGVVRFFPMPKNGQLWNLLKSISEQKPDDLIFPSKTGNPISVKNLSRVWRGSEQGNYPGVITQLIAQGKVSQYLKLYATRHTFISHQVNIHKIPITTVAQWVGNGAMVSNNSYLDRDKMTVPGYSTTPSESTSKKPDDSESNEQMASFVASLTPEQREQFKALLNKE